MKKFLLLVCLSVFGTNQAHAGFIKIVTGADMAGIEVTATFSDMSTEILTWGALTADSGGVTGTGWSLKQVGTTLAGDWTVSNSNTALMSLFINLLPASFVFDTEYGDMSANGSGNGRELVSDIPIGYTFSGLVQDELYTGLTLSNIAAGQTKFLIDTDLVTVSAPTSASILMLSLCGFVMNARRKKA